MSKKKKVVKKSYMVHYIVVFLMLSLGGYFLFTGSNKELRTSESTLGYKQFDFRRDGELTFQTADGKFISQIEIEIADDMVERAVGLMYREKMGANQGMLFIFPQEEYQSFWMKNTVLPLDIVFVNKKNEIVTIHNDATPFSEDSLPSTAPAIYVVEVNAGYMQQHGIKEGDKISWRLN